MTLRQQMVRAAQSAPRVLGESTELVERFLLQQQSEEGSFKHRLGKGDLYYTVFGLHGLLAIAEAGNKPKPELEEMLRRLEQYLCWFKCGSGLDLVHTACLARCWAGLAQGRGQSVSQIMGPTVATALLAQVESFRSVDGGYNALPGSKNGTAYGGFLALGAYEDLDVPVPQANRLAESVSQQQLSDGSWSNAPGPQQAGSTNATAAAIAVLTSLSHNVKTEAGEWLLARVNTEGGFNAAPNVDVPDLLSTATSLHALAALGVSPEPVKERCLDFVDSLWTNEGGFHGHWLDDTLDCEYTFYGLLALGHLSG